MNLTFDQKTQLIKERFSSCKTEEEKYKKIMELGKQLPPLKPEHKTEKFLVPGCQSTTYLYSSLKEGKVVFEAESEALISAGLVALLIHVYSGETPESVLQNPPRYLEELGIGESLTPNRANGLYSMHLKMKQEALTLIMDSGSQ